MRFPHAVIQKYCQFAVSGQRLRGNVRLSKSETEGSAMISYYRVAGTIAIEFLTPYASSFPVDHES